MENYSVVIFLLAIMIILSALADRIKISYPILLVSAGIVMGFFPSMPDVELNPDIVFLIFLPPLLYDAAFNISFKTFATNFNTIGTLAIGLVFLTAGGIAAIGHYVIGLSWPLSFVLGAILSATDAVAAISITKSLGLTNNTATILEGESLVNDASALVVYRFALAAVTGTAFVLWRASLQFLGLMFGGLAVGILLSRLLGFIVVRVKHNTMVTFSFMLLMPFVTYRFAEELHVSGVIAVVTLGLGISRFSTRIFPEEMRMQSKAIWDIIIFLLNGLIFILIGLEFPFIVKRIDQRDVIPFIGYAVIIAVVTFLLRLLRVLWQKYRLQQAFQRKKRNVREEALLTVQESIIITWSGMRGIVSLAIAIGLPPTLDNGAPFPQRDAIIFISTVVVLVTILGQGLTLPWIVKKLAKKQ